MPRKNNSVEKRRDIVMAFGRCLANNDLKNIGVRDIAAEAGVPLGSIHYYFKSKDEILLAYYEKMLGEYIEVYKQWVEHISPEISTFSEFYDSFLQFTLMEYFEYEKTKPSNNYLKAYNLISGLPELKKYYVEMTGKCADLVVEAMKRTKFTCKDPRKFADVLMALLDGFSIFCEVGLEGVDRVELFRTLGSTIAEASQK